MHAASEGTVTSTLRETVMLVAAGCASVAALAACSAGGPRSESALAHGSPKVTSSLTGSTASPSGDDSQRTRIAETPKDAFSDVTTGRCPRSMVDIEGRFCIDRYEASLLDVLPTGEERPHSPFGSVTDL